MPVHDWPIRRSPHGERGLKFRLGLQRAQIRGRSPHGERGLKFRLFRDGEALVRESLSSRRTWIEMLHRRSHRRNHGSLSSRRTWIEIIATVATSRAICRSLSSRRTWIEMTAVLKPLSAAPSRSPHGERGLKYAGQCQCLSCEPVALLTENVD